MQRTIHRELLRWKEKPRRKPLLLTGVRQCGKTFSILEFGKTEFEDVAYVNFEKSQDAVRIFSVDFDIARILDDLAGIVVDKIIVPGRTLLVLDEIQACPSAITALKYFQEDMPGLHVIAAGSLLGVVVRAQNLSFPVGKVDRLSMYPMTFAEFVQANGEGRLLEGLDRFPVGQPFPELYTSRLETLLKQYYIVGGMPEVVQCWIDTHDYAQVDAMQDAILEDYAADFAKHPPVHEIPRIRLIWDSIPIQLAKENNKFVFSHVKKGVRAKELEDSLEWLESAGLIYRLCLVSQTEIPLSGMADATYFKVYMSDVGLLRRKSNLHYKTILEGDALYVRYKGALAENYVLTQLRAMGIPAWFWRNDASAELDFLTDHGGRISPIEVKSADNTKAKSLSLFCLRYGPELAFKVSLRNSGEHRIGETRVLSLPLYAIHRMAACLART